MATQLTTGTVPNAPTDDSEVLAINGTVVFVLGSPSAPFKVRISEDIIIFVSPVFEAMLSGPFVEGRQRSVQQPLVLSLPDDHVEAMMLLLRIMHHQDERVPERVEMPTLSHLVALADKYDCLGVVRKEVSVWIECLRSSFSLYETAFTAISIAYKLQCDKLFQSLTKEAIWDAKPPFWDPVKLEPGVCLVQELPRSFERLMCKQRAHVDTCIRDVAFEIGTSSRIANSKTEMAKCHENGTFNHRAEADILTTLMNHSTSWTCDRLLERMPVCANVRANPLGIPCEFHQAYSWIQVMAKDYVEEVHWQCTGLCFRCLSGPCVAHKPLDPGWLDVVRERRAKFRPIENQPA